MWAIAIFIILSVPGIFLSEKGKIQNVYSVWCHLLKYTHTEERNTLGF